MKAAALAYVAQGFAVVPCWPRTKIPATEHGLKDAVSDVAGVHRLWKRKGCNLALAAGTPSGVFVLDIDGPAGSASLAALEERHGAIPATREVTTGKGRHLYFQHPSERVSPNSNGKLGAGIDVRGDGSLAMLPPSIHPNGHRYTWVDEAAPIAQAPDWLRELVLRPVERPVRPVPTRSSRDGDRRWTDVEVGRMLAVLSPDMAREDWVRVGMALHAGGYGFEMYDAWSRGGEKHRPGDCEAQWRGFRDGGGVTMGSLYAMAKAGGWEPERSHAQGVASRSAHKPHR